MNKLMLSLLILSLATIAPGTGPKASAQDEGARSAFAPQANVELTEHRLEGDDRYEDQ